MSESPGPESPGDDPWERKYRLLQQDHKSLEARFDRQIEQLTRLNKLSDSLMKRLSMDEQRPRIAEDFAEAVAEVLDVALTAVWILPPNIARASPRFYALGLRGAPENEWEAAGVRIAQTLKDAKQRTATRLPPELEDLLPGVKLVQPLVSLGFDKDNKCTTLLLASNTDFTAGNFEFSPINDETLELLSLLAQKCASHLESSAAYDALRRARDLSEQQEKRLGDVLEGTRDGWWEWQLKADRCYVSARWAEIVGLRAKTDGPNIKYVANFLHGFWSDRIHPSDLPKFHRELARAKDAEGESILEMELNLRHEDGHYVPVLVRGKLDKEKERFAGSVLDLSERKRTEAHIHRLAYYDPLTELPNRRLLNERLLETLSTQAKSRQIAAVLMLDLDRFKNLNDIHGHAAGDELLQIVGDRLQENVRNQDTVARLGGDEFVVLLQNLGSDPETAVALAERIGTQILNSLNKPYELSVGTIHHSASIGVALSTDDELTAEILLKHADVALYEAKAEGRNRVRIFRSEMQRRLDYQSAMESQLRTAFETGELFVVYQPQVDVEGQLQSAEALTRWTKADGQSIPPSIFIPVAEDAGLIHRLGEWCIREVCLQLRVWEPKLPPGFRVAVNLSAPQFLHGSFPDKMLSILEETGVPGTRIRLEITEAAALEDLEFAAKRMNELRLHGIDFSLDDFGTGYSSLTYLRRLPVGEVKIDRSYVQRFHSDRHDAAIVRAVLTMCESLDLAVVAEGVETVDQFETLKSEGCSHFQGFLFGRGIEPPDDPHALVQHT